MRVTFCAIAAVAIAGVTAQAAEDYGQWSRWTDVQVDASAVLTGSDEYKFPLLVRLNSRAIDFSVAKIDGSDLRFAKNDGTPMRYEIENWEAATRTAVVWVLVDTVYRAGGQSFRMYYGNPAASDSSSPHAVFDTANGFVATWHLNEEAAGDGTIGLYKDATANGYDGDDWVQSTGRDGVVGYGRRLSRGSSQFYADSIPTAVRTGPSPRSTWTYSAWFHIGYLSPAIPSPILRHSDGTSYSSWYVSMFAPYDHGRLAWRMGAAGPVCSTSVVTDYFDWHYMALVLNGTSASLFVDGQPVSRTATVPVMGATRFLVGQSVPSLMYHTVFIDEVEVMGRSVSDQRVKLIYQTQRPGATVVSMDYRTWPSTQRVCLTTAPGGANVAQSVYKFPLLVRLSGLDLDAFAAGGADIRFSSMSGKPLAYEIERWSNPAGTATDSAEIWVLADTVYGNNATQYLTMHYGKAGALSESNGAAVFDTANGFVGVWHLREEVVATGAAGVYKDATANALDGRDDISAAGQQGAIALGHQFDGANDDVYIGPTSSFQFAQACTWSCWVKADAAAGAGGQALMQQWTPRHLGLLIENSGAGTNKVRWEIANDGVDASSFYSDSTMTPGVWYYVAGAFDGVTDSGHVWVNDDAKGGVMTHPGDMTTCGLYIGRYGYSTWDFAGGLDEPVVSRVARSAAWLKLCYENQRPDQCFVGIGALPARPAVTTQPLVLTVQTGQRAALRITASGSAPLSYAWRHMGPDTTRLSSADSLVFASAALSDSGHYFCVVSNAFGWVSSDTVTLTVEPATGIHPDASNLPKKLMLSATASAVTYGVPAAGLAGLELCLFDVSGRVVWRAAYGQVGSGWHHVSLGQPQGLRTGRYVVRLSATEHSGARRALQTSVVVRR